MMFPAQDRHINRCMPTMLNEDTRLARPRMQEGNPNARSADLLRSPQ